MYIRLFISTVILLCLYSSTTAQAQFRVQSGISINNIRAIEFNDLSKVTSKQFGWLAGIGGSLRLSERWSIDLDANYAVKGYRINQSTSNLGTTFIDYQHGHIDLVPSVSYKIFKPISVSLGLYGSYRLNTKVRGYNQDAWLDLDKVEDQYDAGIQPGISYQKKWYKIFANAQVGVKKNKSIIEFTDINGEPFELSYFTGNVQLGFAVQLGGEPY